MFYLPTITSGVALFILWKAIYNPDFGPLNTALMSVFGLLHIHVKPPDWLLSIAWAKPAIMLMGVWSGIGGTNMLLYLAGLSNVPPELYEAAQIDGAGRWAMFRHVTWPQLAPTTFFIIVMSAIGGLQGGFEQARVMTNGGPAESTVTLGYFIYQKGFEEYQLGFASAIAWVMFVIIFIMTLINWKFGKSAFATEV
jgi:multiple sugar transport system permease protein